VLQAGDCAESFSEFTADGIRDKLKVILQMAVVLTYGAGLPVVKVGRIAVSSPSPAAHPPSRWATRSSTRSAATWSTTIYRSGRRGARPRPARHRLRAGRGHPEPAAGVHQGRFADLSQIHAWNQEFVASSTEGRRFEAIAEGIDSALRFMDACGINLTGEDTLHQVDFWTSHEALILDYEEALTRGTR